MKMFNIHGDLVNIDVRPSKYPMRTKSKSSLQGMVGIILMNLFPNHSILEEFTIPGSRMSVDYFLPDENMVVEIQGEGHTGYTPHFHQDRNLCKFAKQKQHDRKKALWAETNGFKLIEIFPNTTEEEIIENISKEMS